MKKFFLAGIFFVIATLSFSQTAYTIETIPNPKLESNNHYVSNPDNILSQETVDDINFLLRALEDSTTAQVAVVIVNSIGDEVPKDFATSLFRYWQIGQKENNNGLLMLMVIDQRRMEFETGYGLEPILTDALCKRIQVTAMVPRAKEGNYDACLLDGVNEVIKILIDPQYRDEVTADSLTYADYGKPWYRQQAENPVLIGFAVFYLIILLINMGGAKRRLKKAPSYVKENHSTFYMISKVLLLNLALPFAFFYYEKTSGSLRMGEFFAAVYFFLGLLLLEKRFRLDTYVRKTAAGDAYENYILSARSHKGWLAAAIFFPLPFVLYQIAHKRRQLQLRNTPPLCPDCSTPMQKMDEKGDDAFLQKFQLTEEQLHSVDYDVWKCPKNEHDHVKIYRYENLWSKYSDCPSCKSKTYELIKTETIHAATYESAGQGRKTYACKNCHYTKSTTFSIPRLTHSSSGSGGSFGGSSGGGFGGGSSGGGGAGSSW